VTLGVFFAAGPYAGGTPEVKRKIELARVGAVRRLAGIRRRPGRPAADY
jgi:hypothetical protein